MFSDGESDTSGIAWHLHVRDRLPVDLIALVPLLVKQVNRGVKSGATHHAEHARVRSTLRCGTDYPCASL